MPTFELPYDMWADDVNLRKAGDDRSGKVAFTIEISNIPLMAPVKGGTLHKYSKPTPKAFIGSTVALKVRRIKFLYVRYMTSSDFRTGINSFHAKGDGYFMLKMDYTIKGIGNTLFFLPPVRNRMSLMNAVAHGGFKLDVGRFLGVLPKSETEELKGDMVLPDDSFYLNTRTVTHPCFMITDFSYIMAVTEVDKKVLFLMLADCHVFCNSRLPPEPVYSDRRSVDLQFSHAGTPINIIHCLYSDVEIITWMFAAWRPTADEPLQHMLSLRGHDVRKAPRRNIRHIDSRRISPHDRRPRYIRPMSIRPHVHTRSQASTNTPVSDTTSSQNRRKIFDGFFLI